MSHVTTDELDILVRLQALIAAGIDPNERPHHAAQRLEELGIGFTGRSGAAMVALLDRVQRAYADLFDARRRAASLPLRMAA